jgi:hypothetical protein
MPWCPAAGDDGKIAGQQRRLVDGGELGPAGLRQARWGRRCAVPPARPPASGRASGWRSGGRHPGCQRPRLGSGRRQTIQQRDFASPGDAEFDEPRPHVAPDSLRRNQWALSGTWMIERRASVLNQADGRIAFRFHAATSIWYATTGARCVRAVARARRWRTSRRRPRARRRRTGSSPPASRPRCSHSARPPTPLRRQTDTSSRKSRIG